VLRKNKGDSAVDIHVGEAEAQAPWSLETSVAIAQTPQFTYMTASAPWISYRQSAKKAAGAFFPHLIVPLLTLHSGGRADFKWEDVKADSQRENYLGHSLMAPVGRWQQNKDLNWYAKGDDESAESAAQKLKEEKRKLKQAEEDAMLVAMGLPVPERGNANMEPLGEKAGERAIKEEGEGVIKEEDEGARKVKGAEMGPPARRRDRSRDRKERSGRDRRDRNDDERRKRRRSRSRSRDRRDRRRDRSRSRDRARKDDDRHRHRSRSREHRRRDDHDRRGGHREHHRDRFIDEERPRSSSKERQRRRRSRSPYEKDRRKD
jgi:hypothetical protein